MENEQVISQWIYNKPKKKGLTNRRKIGYIMAAKTENGVISIGWSKCAPYDPFDLIRAKEIAFGRLLTGSNTPLPSCFKVFMPEFILRCKKYFQVDDVEPIEYFQ